MTPVEWALVAAVAVLLWGSLGLFARLVALEEHARHLEARIDVLFDEARARKSRENAMRRPFVDCMANGERSLTIVRDEDPS